MARPAWVWALVLLVIAAPAPAAGDGCAIAVIVNLQTTLGPVSVQEVKALYLGEITGIQSKNLRPVGYVAGTPIRSLFDQTVLDMTSEQFAEHWRSKRFLGSFQKQPTAFKSVAAVKKFVAEVEGSIGFVPCSEADASVRTILKLP